MQAICSDQSYQFYFFASKKTEEYFLGNAGASCQSGGFNAVIVEISIIFVSFC